MPDESPIKPRFVVWRCDHCRNGIEFDAVQLAGRETCRVACPHCSQETSLREPPPPPPLIPDEGWTQPPPPAIVPTRGLEKELKKIPVEPPPLPPPAPPNAGEPVAEISVVKPTPPPPPMPAPGNELAPKIPVAPEPEKIINNPLPPPPPVVVEPLADASAANSTPPLVPKPITISLPPEPLPPTHTRAPADVRWLTDLGVVYFKQHQFGEAFLCFSRAAQQGFATAQFCLAVCYFNGHGTARDEAAALPWLRAAAAQGDANAEFTLGLAYSLGRGVAPDPILAAQWLQQAAAHGHPEASLRVGKPTGQSPKPPPDLAGPENASPSSSVGMPLPAEKIFEKRRHDMQRLVLGMFGKK